MQQAAPALRGEPVSRHRLLLQGSQQNDTSPPSPSLPLSLPMPLPVSNPFSSMDGFGIWDVSEAYAPPYANVTSWQRGFSLFNGLSSLLVVDELSAGPGSGNVSWALHTTCNVTLNSSTAGSAGATSASLTCTPPSSSSLPAITASVTLLLPDDCPGVSLQTAPINLSPPQYSSAGFSVLQAVAPDASLCRRVCVLLSDTTAGAAPAPSLDPLSVIPKPLQLWQEQGPVY